MQTWQKHWLKFVATTAVNAGIYISYRLYIHNQKKKKELEDKNNHVLKILKNSPKGSLEEKLINIKKKNKKEMKTNLKIHFRKEDK